MWLRYKKYIVVYFKVDVTVKQNGSVLLEGEILHSLHLSRGSDKNMMSAVFQTVSQGYLAQTHRTHVIFCLRQEYEKKLTGLLNSVFIQSAENNLSRPSTEGDIHLIPSVSQLVENMIQ